MPADPRSDRQDIHNWLVRPNQHLMRQPLLIENLRDRTKKARPGCASIAALELALDKVKRVVSAIDEKKVDYEQRQKIVDISSRLEGQTDSATLSMPHRQLLREGDLFEVLRTQPLDGPPPLDGSEATTRRRLDDGSDGGGRCMEIATANCSWALTDHESPKYGFLCNDSFWYCESHRGNTFTLVHVFQFEASAPPSSSSNPASNQNTPAAAAALSPEGAVLMISKSIDEIANVAANRTRTRRTVARSRVYAGADDSFWLSDDKMAVQLRARHDDGGDASGDGAEWLAAAMGAAQAGSTAAKVALEEQRGPSFLMPLREAAQHGCLQ